MRSWITICIALSLCGGILKQILEATGGEKAAKALQTILSILMLSLAIGALCKEDLPSVSFSNADRGEYYRELQEEMLTEVFAAAKKELGSKLCEEIEAKFEKEPLRCSVSVDRETLALTDVQIYYSTDNIVISTYEIQNYIYNTYGARAEVIFE